MDGNKLFYGDNLEILRQYIPDESVDLIYLDPPFNSNRNYNVLFKDESGRYSDSQIVAFTDTWQWGKTADTQYRDLVLHGPERVSAFIEALYKTLGPSQMMAYIVMMTARIVQLHRVLKSTGSLYLHCDPTASHYLRMVLDATFGPTNFKNQITWKRTSAHSDTRKRFGNVTDIIFFYTKSDEYTFHVGHAPHDEEYLEKFYRHVDEHGRRYRLGDLASPHPRPNLIYEYKGYKPHKNGWRVSREKMEQLDAEGRLHFPKSKEGRIQLKRYLDEMPGTAVTELWDDIKPIGAQAKERLGYPTQKPLKLLERIIEASSNPGDVVLDPFCGCGTAVAAAQMLGRKWIGIDITHLSVALMKYRLEHMFGIKPKADYEVIGEPTTLTGARQLAQDDRFQFQFWASSLVRAIPIGGEMGKRKGKKSVDRGIDGLIKFFDNGENAKLVLVQVKSRKGESADIRELRGTVERENAAIGVFITMDNPTKEMEKEALAAGYYESPLWGKKYRKIQILTIEQLLNGAEIEMPPQHGTFKQAERVKTDLPVQNGLL